MVARRLALLMPMLCAAVWAAAALGQQADETTVPAPAGDPWRDLVLQGKWSEGEQAFTRALVALASDPEGLDLERVAPLHYGLDVCRRFPRMEERLDRDEAARLQQWLLANREFGQVFMLALKEQDDVPRAFEVLYRILEGEGAAQALQFPGLTIAFAVVWDAYPADTDLLLDSFRYFTRNSDRMTFDLAALPYEVGIYVVDTRRPISERLWALDRYEKTDNIRGLYDTIWRYRYDRAAFYGGQESRLADRAPTLQNMREYGGVCAEAATFASEVGKATGVPSVYVRGPSPEGVPHAWIGYMRDARRGAKWDRDTGRLAGEGETSGAVTDPQTLRVMGEEELDFVEMALQTPPASRWAARLWHDVAGVLADAGAAAAAKQAAYLSLNAAVLERRQWQRLAELAGRGVLSQEELLAAMRTLVGQIGDRPGLRLDAFEDLVAALSGISFDERLALYDETERALGSADVEAKGRVRLLKGRFQESQGLRDRAEQTYAQGALDALQSRGVALTLLAEAARLMLERNALSEAVHLHETARSRTSQPTASQGAIFSTWSQITLRLAKLRRMAGDMGVHNNLLDDVVALVPASDTGRDALRDLLGPMDYYQVVEAQ